MTERIFVIAGPNGAGKTTTAMSLIPDLVRIYEFINADEIARGLAPLHPESVSLAASKLMIHRLRELLKANKSFAFETTASGTNYLKYLREAQKKGYEIHLIYLWLSSPDLAVKRVAQRVAQGGHDIPELTIRRRYYGGLRNLIAHYLPLADKILLIDNSTKAGKTIAQKNNQESLKIENLENWEEIQRLANGRRN